MMKRWRCRSTCPAPPCFGGGEKKSPSQITDFDWNDGTSDTDNRPGILNGQFKISYTGPDSDFYIFFMDSAGNRLTKLAECPKDDSVGGVNICTIGAPAAGPRVIDPDAHSLGVFVAGQSLSVTFVEKLLAEVGDDGKPVGSVTEFSMTMGDDDYKEKAVRIQARWRAADDESDMTEYRMYAIEADGTKVAGAVATKVLKKGFLADPPIDGTQFERLLPMQTPDMLFRYKRGMDATGYAHNANTKVSIKGPGMIIPEKYDLEALYDRVHICGERHITGNFSDTIYEVLSTNILNPPIINIPEGDCIGDGNRLAVLRIGQSVSSRFHQTSFKYRMICAFDNTVFETFESGQKQNPSGA